MLIVTGLFSVCSILSFGSISLAVFLPNDLSSLFGARQALLVALARRYSPSLLCVCVLLFHLTFFLCVYFSLTALCECVPLRLNSSVSSSSSFEAVLIYRYLIVCLYDYSSFLCASYYYLDCLCLQSDWFGVMAFAVEHTPYTAEVYICVPFISLEAHSYSTFSLNRHRNHHSQ